VKLFGPVHEYVAPAIVLAVRFIVPPSHTGLLLPAVGAAGIEFTTTTVVPAGPVHPFTVAVTLYVPAIAVDALGIEGYCKDEAKFPGPVHEYIALGIELAERSIVPPTHTGPLLSATGAEGKSFTVIVPVAEALPQFPTRGMV